MPGQQTVGNLVVNISANPMGLSAGLMSAERMLERTGTRMYFLGQRVAMGFSVPIAVLVGAISKVGLEFDKAMTESLAIMQDVTPKIRAEMEKVAKAVSETSTFDATEVAKGYYHLASAGYSAEESIALIPVAAKFAQAGVMDLAKATEYLAGVQQALGMRSDDVVENMQQMTRVSDVLTEANNRALGTIEDFAKALTNKAGAQLRMFHKDIEEGTAVLMAYASQNIKGAAAGTQFMMFQRDMARFAIKNTEAFEKFNIKVFSGSGALRNYADIVRDFENATKGMSDAEQVMMFRSLGLTDRSRHATQALIGMSDAIRGYEADLRSAGGATETVANRQLKALSNQLQMAWHQIKNAAISLFVEFSPAITDYVIPALQGFGRMLTSIAGVVRDMPDWIKTLTLSLAGLGIVIGPLIMYMGSWLLMFRGITTPIALATRELQAFNLAQAAMTGAPIALGATGAAGVGAFGRASQAAVVARRTVLTDAAIEKPLSVIQLTSAIRRTEAESRRLTGVLNRETEQAATNLIKNSGTMSRTITRETSALARAIVREHRRPGQRSRDPSGRSGAAGRSGNHHDGFSSPENVHPSDRVVAAPSLGRGEYPRAIEY